MGNNKHNPDIFRRHEQTIKKLKDAKMNLGESWEGVSLATFPDCMKAITDSLTYPDLLDKMREIVQWHTDFTAQLEAERIALLIPEEDSPRANIRDHFRTQGAGRTIERVLRGRGKDTIYPTGSFFPAKIPDIEKEPIHKIKFLEIKEGCYRCGNTSFEDDTVVVYCRVCGLIRGHENMVTDEDKKKWRAGANGRANQ